MRAQGQRADWLPVEIPTLPAVVGRVLALYGDEHTTTELVRLLEADPAISSRLLRLANSAYFGFRRQVATVERAVLIVGRGTVQAVALAATLIDAWKDRAVPAAAEELWAHGYLCGLGCRHLAERLPAAPSRSESDTLFLTGLLHDVGKLLFLAELPEAYVEDLQTNPDREALLSRERQRFGQDHAEVGGDALEAWNFPVCVAEAVRFHHANGLRAELRPDWEVLTTVDDVLRGLQTAGAGTALPSPLVVDVAKFVEDNREEALAFYRAVS